jgi:hypothetical protein
MHTYPTLSAGLAGALLAMSASAQAATTYTQGFEDVESMEGWVFLNQSAPEGSSWFQGNSGIFSAQAGSDNSYIAASYLSIDSSEGVIDNWLISPVLTFTGAAQLSFYTRSAGTEGFNDVLQVLYSSDSGLDTATFSQSLLSIGGATAYPDGWQQYTANFTASGTGRFAFRYGGTASTADYIGIDSLSVTGLTGVGTVPEPSGYALFGAGLAMIALLRRKGRRVAGAGLALAALGMAQGAAAQQQEGMVAVRDAETGQLRAPTPQEAQALRAAGNSSTSTLQKQTLQATRQSQVTRRADGTRAARVSDRAMAYSVVTRDENGQLREQCVAGAEKAAALQSATSAATTSANDGGRHDDK